MLLAENLLVKTDRQADNFKYGGSTLSKNGWIKTLSKSEKFHDLTKAKEKLTQVSSMHGQIPINYFCL